MNCRNRRDLISGCRRQPGVPPLRRREESVITSRPLRRTWSGRPRRRRRPSWLRSLLPAPPRCLRRPPPREARSWATWIGSAFRRAQVGPIRLATTLQYSRTLLELGPVGGSGNKFRELVPDPFSGPRHVGFERPQLLTVLLLPDVRSGPGNRLAPGPAAVMSRADTGAFRDPARLHHFSGRNLGVCVFGPRLSALTGRPAPRGPRSPAPCHVPGRPSPRQILRADRSAPAHPTGVGRAA